MDVLLIQPQFTRTKRSPNERYGYIPPLMLYSLGQPLMDKGFHVDILDLAVYQINYARLQEYAKTYRPKVVGITTTTENFSSAAETARRIKAASPETEIVIGGPHVTFQAEETLAYDFIDFVVRGEGETAFTKLVEHVILNKHSLDDINNLSHRKNGSVSHNSMKFVEDMDSLPIPSRSLLNPSRYAIPGAISASRGCPFKCHFCSGSIMAGGKYRMRSVDNIMREIDYLVVNLGIRYLTFLDLTLTGFPKRTKQICEHILRKGYRIGWFCESRVDVADRELLQLMARSGCRTVQFGFESGNETILKSINKKITPEQIEKAVGLALESGIAPVGNFLIGFPEDTEETIRDTFNLARKLKKRGSGCELGVLTPFPGTFFYENAEKLGMTIHSTNWDDFALDNPIISTKNLSLDQLRSMYTEMRMELSGGFN